MIKLRKEYKSMRMLIVEDEKDLCNILKKRLQKDYTIDICMDGEIAKDYLNTYTYDIILLDINMPNSKGIELLEEIRKMDWNIPILILAAFNEVDILLKSIKYNITNYIVKPMQLNTTLKIISQLMEVKEQKRELVRELTGTASKLMNVPEQAFIVLLKENDQDNIGFGGQLLSERK